MKKASLFGILIPLCIGVVALLVFSVSRRDSWKMQIPNADLDRSLAIWTNRNFIEVAREADLRNAITVLASQLPLSPDSRREAEKSSLAMVKALAAKDLDLFLSARLPIARYETPPDAAAALKKYAPSGDSALEMYRSLWTETYRSNALFSSVSFVTNSLSVIEVAASGLENVPLPEFTERSNQNWLEATPTAAFTYWSHISKLMQEDRSMKVLRLFFFGKGTDPGGARPFMIVFAWDRVNSVWLPLQFTHASVRPTFHTIRFF